MRDAPTHPARPGVGVDVVEVAALRRRLAEQPGLANVLFTAREREDAAGHADPVARLAEGFASKEAFVKALRRGLSPGGPDAWLHAIELTGGASGRPGLALGAAPRRALAARGLAAPVLALARDGRHALATVLLVPDARPGPAKEGA